MIPLENPFSNLPPNISLFDRGKNQMCGRLVVFRETGIS